MLISEADVQAATHAGQPIQAHEVHYGCILGVVITEIRGGGTIISAAFTGTKIISGKPIDDEPSSGA